ncbi:MAG: GNAT family N-acetyltransferase [Planctomycetota bacterium]
MPTSRPIAEGIDIRPTEPHHAGALEVLQTLVFPTLARDELFRAEHYRKHLELFPEGQFVAVVDGGCSGEAVVGSTSTLRLGDACLQPHRFADVSAGGFLTTHEPAGRWMYGVDVGVHPQWRRRGIARGLYAARQEAARRLGLAGQVTVGMLSGYGAVRDRMTAAAYYAELVAGERTDPTVSAQQKLGFEPRGLVAEYVEDPVCDGYGVLLVLPIETEISWPQF